MSNNIIEKIRQVASNLRNKVSEGVENFKIDLPANSAYVQALVSQKIAPRETLPKAEEYHSQWGPAEEVSENLSYLPTKSMSAELAPWPVAPDTTYNQQLEAQKQQIVNSGVFRPAMARYLSTVPVWGSFENVGGGMTTMSSSDGYNVPQGDLDRFSKNTSWEDYANMGQPAIQMGISPEKNDYTIDPLSQNKNLESVLAHELIHAAPRNNSLRNEFNYFFQNINPQKSPLLYNAGLTYLKNGKMPPNAEEFYTTIAQQLGPQVLKLPEVQKFFQNIFQ